MNFKASRASVKSCDFTTRQFDIHAQQEFASSGELRALVPIVSESSEESGGKNSPIRGLKAEVGQLGFRVSDRLQGASEEHPIFPARAVGVVPIARAPSVFKGENPNAGRPAVSKSSQRFGGGLEASKTEDVKLAQPQFKGRFHG